MIDIKSKRRYLDEGIDLARFIDDMILNGQFTQSEVAHHMGISETHMSFILNPLHPATPSVVHLPILMRLFDGKPIARKISGFVNMGCFDLPSVYPNGHSVVGETAGFLKKWDDFTKDGKLTIQEAEALRQGAKELLGSLEGYIAAKVEGI